MEDVAAKEKEWLEAVRDDGEVLMDIPEEMKTPDICMAAVESAGCALEWVPDALKTEELCRVAVQNSGYALEWVPDELMDEDMCLDAVMDEGDALGYVPERLKTKRVCMAAWNNENFCEFAFMPEEMITPKMCREFISKYPGMFAEIPDKFKSWDICAEAVTDGPSLAKYVPESVLTAKFVTYIVTRLSILYCRNSGKCPKFNEECGELFEALPEDVRGAVIASLQATGIMMANNGHAGISGRVPRAARDEDFNVKIMEVNGRELAVLDKDELTERVCLAAMKNWPAGLEKIPSQFRTADLCLDCVRRAPLALKGVPAKLKTPALCLEAVWRDGMALKFVPDKLKTLELCRLAAKRAGDGVFKFVPEDLLPAAHDAAGSLTEEECLEAAEMNGLALEWIPEKFRTKAVCEAAVRQNGEALAWVPEKLKTVDLCVEAVQCAPACSRMNFFIPDDIADAVSERCEAKKAERE